MQFDISIDSRLDQLAAEAQNRLAAIPGKPTAAETVTEIYRGMVRTFGGGYHVDTDPEDYATLPEGYSADLVSAIQTLADEHDLDQYEIAILTNLDMVRTQGGQR